MKLETLSAHDAVSLATAALTGAIATNYYRQPFDAATVLVATGEGAIVVLVPEGDFHRLYYVAANADALTDALQSIAISTDIAASEIHRGTAPEPSPLMRAGFQPYRTYQRMLNRTIAATPRDPRIEFAREQDAARLYDQIHEVFDKFADHLPSRARLGERIARDEVLVHRRNGEIAGFVVFVGEGTVANFNYLFNAAGREITDALINTFYAVAHERGLRRTHLWVDRERLGIVRLYERFGWNADGTIARYHVRTYERHPRNSAARPA
jgi:hypothetical protein